MKNYLALLTKSEKGRGKNPMEVKSEEGGRG